MRKRTTTRLIHEGSHVAEVKVELEYTEDAWLPYLSVEEATKLDRARQSLRQGNIQAAMQWARVYELMPVQEG